MSTVNPQVVMTPIGIVGLDFETYGNTNLPKYGLDRYVNCSSFRPLIVSVDDGKERRTFDFVKDEAHARAEFQEYVDLQMAWGYYFAAHNVGFERAVMAWLGYPDDVLFRITDSAVVARAQGAASQLEAAAPQLTDLEKLEVGKQLIMKFSVPTDENGGRPYTWEEIQADPALKADWELFGVYCEDDAAASRVIVETYLGTESWAREHEMEWYTFQMNRAGWNVDLELVREMQLRFEDNSAQLVSDFYALHGTLPDGTPAFTDKFLNSTPQMKAWCAERGIKTSSFDQEHVTKLLARIQKKLGTMNPTDSKYDGYEAVEALLITKRELGGSSLAKLQKILDLTGADGRLRNQYMHLGAGQSYRSTGKGVQLQNLKRLSSSPMDFENDLEEVEEADNTTLAENLRQVFIADVPEGYQIVGDFSSVESRGLAWIAGDDVKIQAFRDGKDLYKVQAELIHGTPYDQVTKAERQDGKVAELGCGYGAGPGALMRFAGKMGIEMDEEKALEIVRGWRGTNPNVVDLWDRLTAALQRAVQLNAIVEVKLAHGLSVHLTPFEAPASLAKQHPGVQSLRMTMYASNNTEFVLERVFQGVYMRGDDVCFYKPSDRKTGDLWRNHYKDPKTGQTVFYKVYGGKLTGIMVQSMCRELFFDAMRRMYDLFGGIQNVTPIGQFHDELVVSWRPKTDPRLDLSVEDAMATMEIAMSEVRPSFAGFPLVGDIKKDYRYTK